MTEQELQELREKLAKWTGFEKFHHTTTIEGKIVGEGDYFHNLPDLTKSFDACLKHLVPKVLEEHAIIETYSFKQASGLYYSETEIWDKGCRDSSTIEVLKCKSVGKAFVQDFDLEKANTLALCLAVEKLIDKEAE